MQKTPINKIVLEWGHLSHKYYKRSIWIWSIFHLKNWLSAKKTPIKPIKIKKDKKKTIPRDRIRPNLEQIGTYLGIEAVTLLFLLQTHKHLFYCKFCNQEGLKSLQKNCRSTGEFFFRIWIL